MKRSFASDNNSGIHPRIWAALDRANEGHELAYGADGFTPEAVRVFRREFGAAAQVFPVLNGTGANVLGTAFVARSFHSILCADVAHLAVDETGAPEKFSGCKVVPLPSVDGKIRPEQIEPLLVQLGDQHRAQPRVVSLSQPTELGTLYSLAEVRAFAAFARANGLFLHVDGARIANAAAALGLGFRELVTETGVDILSFGGTKNGMFMGEAVVFFERIDAADFPFLRKQGLQLASKMRYLSAQFLEYFTDELWRANALHANRMAKLLAGELRELTEIRVTRPVETNAIFASVPPALIAPLQAKYPFYVWDAARNEVRWMTSFDTTEADVREFAATIREVLADR